MFTNSKLIVSAAVLALCVCTTQAFSAGIGFRNDLRPIQPVIVQGASVAGDMVRRGQPLLIFPGRISWDNRLDPGVRVITIHDATQPTRILQRQAVPFVGQDLFYSIQYDKLGNIVLIPAPLIP